MGGGGGGGLGLVDPQLWHACAGGMVQMPAGGSKVVYFPQGHGEQAASAPAFPPRLLQGPWSSSGSVICRVTAVTFLADTETDEVYARMTLQPVREEEEEEEEGSGMADEAAQQAAQLKPAAAAASFAKTLTQSDANNGGGFSVPRYCADTIFPPLDYAADPGPPVQTVLARDVHGATWKFRHIYRGTPRRHLLTTGWSAFVNRKKLVAGDAIVFMRSSGAGRDTDTPGDLCVGVRRAMTSLRGSGAGDRDRRGPQPRCWGELKGSSDTLNFGEFAAAGDNAGGGRGGGHGAISSSSFARSRARVTARSVLEAAASAAAGRPFEVLYYPRSSTAEFCVRAASVTAALRHRWYAGTRFKMALETEDSARTSWVMGTVTGVAPADPVLWPDSPWRLLQVTWDEPDPGLLQGVSRVSPWRVELVSTLPMQMPPPFFAIGLTTTCKKNLGHTRAWHHGLVENVSAGMQEARQLQEPSDGQALRANKAPHAAGLLLDQCYRQHHHQLVLPPSHASSLEEHHNGSAKMSSFTGLGTAVHASPASQQSSSGTRNAAPFVLFGQAIHLTDKLMMKAAAAAAAVKPKQQQQDDAAGSASDDLPSGSIHTSTADSGLGQAPQAGSTLALLTNVPAAEEECFQFYPPGTDGVAGGSINKTAALFDSSHCKVFKDTEEVGRTVDLAIFSGYDELFVRLAKMFCMDKMELQMNLVYRNAQGSTRQVGHEPYRNFMHSVRRLTILPDAGACCAAATS